MASKITELINKEDAVTYSLEVTPDIEKQELDDLNMEPLFFSVTWHANLHENKDLEIPPLALASYLRSKDKNVLLHISCTKMRKDFLNNVLDMLQDKGICNLFLILGEKFDSSKSDFQNTRELIIYIRERTGSYFCIGVAGFPDKEENVLQLKEKITSGVDFILTQAFFEYKSFEKFKVKCEEVGISVPIIPSMFPFETERELDGFVNMCKVHVSDDFRKILKAQAASKIIDLLINEIVRNLKIKHIHFFTLNKLQRTFNLLKISCINLK